MKLTRFDFAMLVILVILVFWLLLELFARQERSPKTISKLIVVIVSYLLYFLRRFRQSR